MPPTGALKADVNRSGWESSDFPSVCESCLPDNPFVQMIKENHGMECKICTRPFTVFRWAADRNSRFKKTNICLTCARLKNCCQCCMLDLTFGLPIVVRDAALKLVAQGPSSGINKEFYAQNAEGKLKDGEIPEEYEKTDAAARDLLKRLATSQPYYKKQRRAEGDSIEGPSQPKAIEGRQSSSGGPGPIRTQRGGASGRGRGGAGVGGRKGFTAHGAPQDAAPPQDPTITSLFLTGVEDDLPEYAIRQFFEPFGALRSIVCVHRSRAAFVNFATRAGAEAAAASCQGRAVIQGCPLRIQWGKPRPLGNFDRTQAALAAKAAAIAKEHRPVQQERNVEEEEEEVRAQPDEGLALGQEEEIQIALPPGAAGAPKYQSQIPQ